MALQLIDRSAVIQTFASTYCKPWKTSFARLWRIIWSKARYGERQLTQQRLSHWNQSSSRLVIRIDQGHQTSTNPFHWGFALKRVCQGWEGEVIACNRRGQMSACFLTLGTLGTPKLWCTKPGIPLFANKFLLFIMSPRCVCSVHILLVRLCYDQDSLVWSSTRPIIGKQQPCCDSRRLQPQSGRGLTWVWHLGNLHWKSLCAHSPCLIMPHPILMAFFGQHSGLSSQNQVPGPTSHQSPQCSRCQAHIHHCVVVHVLQLF